MAQGLPQEGGEGKESYKGNKSDMNLPQYGGEGKNFGNKSSDISFKSLSTCFLFEFCPTGHLHVIRAKP